jgi:protease I
MDPSTRTFFEDDSDDSEDLELSTKRIACLLAPEYEDSEFRVPFNRLRAAGFRVDIIGKTRGQELTGHKRRDMILTEYGIDEVDPLSYHGLLIPGGHSPDQLRADPRFVRFVQEFDRTQQPIAAICHGPQLLITAGLVVGRTMTAWTTIQEDLRQIGADVRDEAVVVDGNWITSRKPDDVEAFSGRFIEALGGDEQQSRVIPEARPQTM